MNKILITGAGGFIGSHLTERCVKDGMKVRAFVHYNSMNNWGWLEDSPYKDDIEIVAGDIRDYDSVNAAMKGCHTVMHLAALIGIPYSYVSPLAYVKTNIEGTYNVVQAAKELCLDNVLVTSTSETYGTAQSVPINETHPLVGQSPYAASKIGADQMALSYYRSFGLPVRVVRPFNTYGPRQSARAIIPTVITQILSGNKSIHLGNITPTRDFTFVKDTVEGFLAILRSDATVGEVTNIGMNTEISVGDLVQTIGSLIGQDVEIIEDQQRVRAAKSEVERLCCDNARLKMNTDWNANYTLTDGLQETITWLEKRLDLYKTEIYNV